MATRGGAPEEEGAQRPRLSGQEDAVPGGGLAPEIGQACWMHLWPFTLITDRLRVAKALDTGNQEVNPTIVAWP